MLSSPIDRTIRVLVVDDDPMARAGIAGIVQGDPGLTVIGEATDGDEVIGMCDRHHPDVVLMDIQMKRMNGIQATAALQRRVAPPKVIALTAFDLDRYVYEALEAGAAGFLLKDTAPAEIKKAIREVVAGDNFLSPRSTRHLIAHFHRPNQQLLNDSRQRLGLLSDRELEVAQAVWQGLSNKEIAARLFMAEATVKTHVSKLMTKMDAPNRVQVALIVERAG